MKANLFINDIPRYVRVYDNGGETIDRYTVVFTKKSVGRGRFLYLGMNAYPFHGIGQHGESDGLCDKPTYSHLGKKIAFTDLPEDCQRAAIDTYKDLWSIQ